MDRLTRMLPLRLLVPLLGLALASLPWLALRSNTTLPVAKTAPPPAAVPLSPPATLTAAAAPARPSLLPIAKDLLQLSPRRKSDPTILATAFPATAFPAAGNGPDTAPDANGPALMAPAQSPDLNRPPVIAAPHATNTPGAKPPVQEPPATVRELPRTLAQPSGSLLLPVEPPATRSEQLEKTARQADQQILHGFEMANREAYFAARADFVAALRLVAQGLDAERRTTAHSRALSAGLTAMKEAQDFLPTGGKLEADLDLPAIIASHRTPVLKNAPAENLLPLVALKSYFTFAQEQLSLSAGHEVAGSMALYALGKLHAVGSRQKTLELPAAEPKAMVYYQAALLVLPRNYMAANDLGALLAQGGYYSEARSALEHSLLISRQSTTLNNLAVVYRHLGQPRLADQARQQAELTHAREVAQLRARQTSANGLVQWIDPRGFAETMGDSTNPPRTVPAQPTTLATRQPVPAFQAPPPAYQSLAPAYQPPTPAYVVTRPLPQSGGLAAQQPLPAYQPLAPAYVVTPPAAPADAPPAPAKKSSLLSWLPWYSDDAPTTR